MPKQEVHIEINKMRGGNPWTLRDDLDLVLTGPAWSRRQEYLEVLSSLSDHNKVIYGLVSLGWPLD